MADVLVLKVHEQRCVLPVSLVVEIAPMVHIVPIATLQPPLLGYIWFRAQAVAVVDLAQRLGERPGPPAPEDHLVVVKLPDRLVALRVDRVLEVVNDWQITPTPIERSAAPVAGVMPQADGTLLVVDLLQLLSLEERRNLSEALSQIEGTPPSAP